MSARTLGALAAILLAADPALAAGGDSGVFWEVLNLLLLIAVLIFLARRPVLNFLSERRADIEESLEASEQLLRDAEGRLSEWTQRADHLETEIEDIRRLARERAEQEGQRIVADAEAAAERIRREAESAVDREVRRAREILRAEASDLAVELAAERLRAEVNDGDRDRLVDEFVRTIESAGSGRSH